MLLLLLFAQSGPVAAEVKQPDIVLAVPPGACMPQVDGVPVPVSGLAARTAQWASTRREVRFEPAASADGACVSSVLAALAKAGAGEAFPIKFADNDIHSGVDSE